MNDQEKYLGRVQDLVIDPSGRVIFAIIGYSTFSLRLIGGNSVAVPFNTLVYEGKAKHPRVMGDTPLEKFKSAPRFAEADLTDRRREAEICRYFGQQPCWTERETTGK